MSRITGVGFDNEICMSVLPARSNHGSFSRTLYLVVHTTLQCRMLAQRRGGLTVFLTTITIGSCYHSHPLRGHACGDSMWAGQLWEALVAQVPAALELLVLEQ